MTTISSNNSSQRLYTYPDQFGIRPKLPAPKTPEEAAKVKALKANADVVDTKFQLIRLLEKSDNEILVMEDENVSDLQKRFVALTPDDLKTFSTQQLSRLVFRLVLGHADLLTKRGLNDFLRKLPSAVRDELGYKDIPKAPYQNALAPKELGFNGFTSRSDKAGSVDALNACMRKGYDFELDEIEELAIEMFFDRNIPAGTHYSPTRGMSETLQSRLIEVRGYAISEKHGLEGSELKKWLESMNCHRCIIESSRAGAQFPGGLVEKEPRQAALRLDDNGKWWLLNSNDEVAIPVDFDYIAKGEFTCKALLPRLTE